MRSGLRAMGSRKQERGPKGPFERVSKVETASLVLAMRRPTTLFGQIVGDHMDEVSALLHDS